MGKLHQQLYEQSTIVGHTLFCWVGWGGVGWTGVGWGGVHTLFCWVEWGDKHSSGGGVLPLYMLADQNY